jgi:benzylsuccinate CoA-transferase BbsE subunit
MPSRQAVPARHRDRTPLPTALGHLRVLEVVDDVGEFCGKMLADMGADVVRVEPPEGAATRRIGPFLEDNPHPERSLHFWHYNTNKRSVTVDLDRGDGQALFRRLAEGADILVESMPPGYMDERGLSYEDLRRANPRLVYVSLSAFGRGGPRGGMVGGDLAGWASSGYMYTTGWTWHPPTRAWGRQAAHIGCLYAASAALSALVSRRRTGKGQHVDVSLQEALASANEGSVPFYVGDNQITGRRNNDHINSFGFKVLPCKDGWVHFSIGWRNGRNPIVEWMADEEVAGDLTDEKWKDDEYNQAHFDHVVEVVSRWTQTKTKAQFFNEGQKRDIECAPVYSVPEVFEDPQIQHRDFWVDVEHPELGRGFTYPGAPYAFAETPWSMWRRAPLIGEDNGAVYGEELGLDGDDLTLLAEKGII